MIVSGSTLQLSGQATIATITAEQHRAFCHHVQNAHILYIDCQHIQHIDSVGAALMLSALRHRHPEHSPICWTHIPPHLNTLVQLYAINTWITVQ